MRSRAEGYIMREPRVTVRNLEGLAAEVRSEYFPDADALRVEWGRNPHARRRRRSIRLGSYHRGTRVIRIHPQLNSSDVPVYFIQSIIHHEYLHHILGPSHDRRFHRHERRFRFHREAKDWLQHNLPMLLGLRTKPKHADRRRLRKRDETPAVQLTLFGK